MIEHPMTHQLEFVVAESKQDEASVLAQAVRRGLELLYKEAFIEAYLMGRVSREKILNELGAEELADIEFQRDAFRRDVAWGLADG
ncbi:MAG: hypothetical protein HY741_24535 [Chloroflexi bacterium]|nr:hypothetical protein [Chloroflexota bacterium]